MPEQINTSTLSFEVNQQVDANVIPLEDNRPTVVKVENVSMTFNMASEKLNSLKEYFLKIAKRQLFFEELIALDNISFEIKKGDVFGILGTNGSGKSTLLKIIAGVLDPTKGSVEINGGIAPLIELGAGFDMDLSARENIYLNGSLLGYSREFIDEHFEEIIKFAEIEKFLDMPMKNYSSGMVARIAFAIATIIVPEILIVDEVLSVGDFMFQKKCEDRITELIEKHGVTVLIVSHSNDQVERLCNKAIWIEKGHTRIAGDTKRVCSAYRALGGRTGSTASEDFIFDCYVNGLPLKISELDIFKSTNPYNLSNKLVGSFWEKEPPESVILVPDYTHVFALAISPIAGALGAPVIPFERDNYVSTTFPTLFSLKPNNVLIVAHMERAEEMIHDPWFNEIGIEPAGLFCGNGFNDINPAILEYGVEHDIWHTDTAFVVSSSEVVDSFPLAAYSYSHCIPLIIVNVDDGGLDERTSSLLSRIGVTKLLALELLNSPSFIAQADAEGFSVEAATTKTHCEAFNRHSEKLLEQDNREELFITSANMTFWNYLISVPSVAGHCNSPLLIVDDTDLNDTANSLKFIVQSSFGRIIAVGHANSLDANNSLLVLLKKNMKESMQS